MQGTPHNRPSRPRAERTYEMKTPDPASARETKQNIRSASQTATTTLRNAPAEPGRVLNRRAEEEYRREVENERIKKEEKKQQALAERPIRLLGHAQPRVHTVRAKVKKPFPALALLLAVICSVLALFVIYNSVRLSEYRSHVHSVQSEVQKLEQEKKDLQLELDKKNDLLLIEKYAISFGMVRTDQLTQYYITISGDDVIEAYKQKPLS